VKRLKNLQPREVTAPASRSELSDKGSGWRAAIWLESKQTREDEGDESRPEFFARTARVSGRPRTSMDHALPDQVPTYRSLCRFRISWRLLC
jgi:hypothetical protein